MRLRYVAVGAITLLLASPIALAELDEGEASGPTTTAVLASDGTGAVADEPADDDTDGAAPDDGAAVTPAVAGTAADGCAEDEAPHTVRWSGEDRWATAACLALLAFPEGADAVVLARGDTAGGWADALAGTVLADQLDAPVLLSPPDALPAVVEEALAQLAPSEVVLLGGVAALSPAVEAAAAVHAPTSRVAGDDRVATALAVAERAGRPSTVFVVGARRPADALVAGAAAARAGAALLLADDRLDPATASYVGDAADAVVVVGGSAAVPEAVADELRGLVGPARVRRVAGPDRGETAAAVARAFPAPGPVHLVSGADASLVDAIGAGWVAARDGGPVLYARADALGRAAERHLLLGGLELEGDVRLVGGPAALDDAVAAAVASARSVVEAGGPEPELRGVWVHLLDRTLKTRAGIDAVLDDAVAAGLNTVVVQAARRHDGWSSGAYLPRTTDEAAGDLALLDELVPAAHARGLEVHAWFSVMPSIHPTMGDERLPDDHVHRRHGPGSDDPWVTTGPVAGYDYMDPGLPGVQDHVVAMLRDVVTHHDVDAVHLDYLRYSGDEAGRLPAVVARYEAHGTGSFDDWRRQQTADLARRIYVEVAEVDPTVQVSMAAIAQGAGPEGADLRAAFRGTRAHDVTFQDWPSWVEGGFMDVAMPMAYFRESRHAAWFDQWARWAATLAADNDATVAVGIGAWFNSTAEGLAQIDRARAAGADGIVVYSHQGDTTGPRGELLEILGRTRFAEPAPAPTPAQKAAPTGGHLLVTVPDGTMVEVTHLATGATRTVQADAAGNATFVHLPAGEWDVATPGGVRRVTITAGRTTRG